MDEWSRSVFAARAVLSEDPRRMPAAAAAVRPVVYRSWRRSKLQGLEPGRVAPVFQADLDLDSYVTRAVDAVVEDRRAVLEQTGCALLLTDQDGRMLRRWVTDRAMTARLDTLQVAPRFSFAESHVGTTSAIALLDGTPVQVNGPEHFAENLHDLSCAGAPIFHPVTRSLLGTLDVTCRLPDASPFVLTWVTELVREVENALLASTSRREQLLLRSYLAHNHDSRHPLVVLDQNTIISNAVAARLIDPHDQARLWEHAGRALSERGRDAAVLTLADGGRISVETRAVTDGADTIGAVLRIKPLAGPGGPASPGPAASLPGLVGVGPAWRELCSRAARCRGRDRVLVTGETGSGRTAVTRALAGPGPCRTLDARDVGSVGPDRWLADLAAATDTLVLRHLDRLEPDLARATAAALAGGPPRRLLATADAGTGSVDFGTAGFGTAGSVDFGTAGSVDFGTAGFDAVLEVPPLRSRLDDLPVLLAEFSRRAAGGRGEVRWLPDAVQVLTRLAWPGNVAALEALVRRVVAQFPDGGRIGAAALPPDVVAGAARRPLAALEQAEATAILTALRDAGGNKDRAARSLGIARSTLYRKVRALGLDLSASAF